MFSLSIAIHMVFCVGDYVSVLLDYYYLFILLRIVLLICIYYLYVLHLDPYLGHEQIEHVQNTFSKVHKLNY